MNVSCFGSRGNFLVIVRSGGEEGLRPAFEAFFVGTVVDFILREGGDEVHPAGGGGAVDGVLGLEVEHLAVIDFERARDGGGGFLNEVEEVAVLERLHAELCGGGLLAGAVVESLLGAAALGDLLAQAIVDGGELGGALLDLGFGFGVGAAERFFGFLPLCDVLGGGHERDGLADLVDDGFSADVEDALVTVAGVDAMVDLEGCSIFAGAADFVLDAAAVLEVDKIYERLEGCAGDVIGKRIDALEVVGPGDVVGADVPFPASKAGEVLSFGEEHFAAVDLLLSFAAEAGEEGEGGNGGGGRAEQDEDFSMGMGGREREDSERGDRGRDDEDSENEEIERLQYDSLAGGAGERAS